MKSYEYDLKIAKAVRALRELKGIKQLNIADALCMNECNYSRIEKGEVTITPGQLKLIANEIQVSIILIFGIADADEQINFEISSLSDILIKFVMLFKDDQKEIDLSEKEVEFIIRKIKTNYEKARTKKA